MLGLILLMTEVTRVNSLFPPNGNVKLATIAANLEAADNDFVRIESGLAAYATSYGTYMTKEEMQSQIKKLELVLEFDESNLEIAHRMEKWP